MSRGTLLWAACALALAGLPITAGAGALLRCDVTYAGSTQAIEARPVSDPYPVPSIDVGGRFRFKAVVVGDDTKVERVLIYAYLDAKRQPLLVQQAKYLPPYPVTTKPYPLTGEQHVYAGVAERELIYSCTLEGMAP